MPTSFSRRTALLGGGALLAARTMAPLVARAGAAAGAPVDPATAARNRLVVLCLAGGNDGLNTVVPVADAAGTSRRSVYDRVRPSIGYAPSALLPLDRPDDAPHQLGLNPRLARLHRLYRSGRVAVVQGVDYPGHSYSHFVSTDVWQSGQPDVAPDSGWLGRHLDRAGVGPGELRAVAVADRLPLVLAGRHDQGVNLRSVPVAFADGRAGHALARHAALDAFGAFPPEEVLRHAAGATARQTAQLARRTRGAPTRSGTGNGVADALLAARLLLEGDYGVEVVHVEVGGFDTHAGQVPVHEARLRAVDEAIDLFLHGDASRSIAPLAPAVASRTLLMTYSEFGRRLGENGSGGTDHGAAAPVLLVGPAGGRLRPGLHGDHPDVGTTRLPAEDLAQTTDLRSLYQTILQDWLADPDPGYAVPTLPLFSSA